jgi:hypothetical protein
MEKTHRVRRDLPTLKRILKLYQSHLQQQKTEREHSESVTIACESVPESLFSDAKDEPEPQPEAK